MAITPAMREGSGMVEFSVNSRIVTSTWQSRRATRGDLCRRSGDWWVQTHCRGIYSTFLQRAHDQVLHDVAIQKLPVLFAIDRAGIVGADGQTHQGAFDPLTCAVYRKWSL